MLRPVLTIALALGVATAVVAQSDEIATRRNIMKANGAAARTGGQMAKGEIPFDLEKAQAVYKSFGSAAATYGMHFPDNSKTGGETTAAPAIWENKADFQARLDAWGKDIQKASAETKDLDTFKAGFGTVTKACGGCHQLYRVKT